MLNQRRDSPPQWSVLGKERGGTSTDLKSKEKGKKQHNSILRAKKSGLFAGDQDQKKSQLGS